MSIRRSEEKQDNDFYSVPVTTKKARLCNEGYCTQSLLNYDNLALSGYRIGRDHAKLQKMLNDHGFRTSKVLSPREAVSVYKDSSRITNANFDKQECDENSRQDVGKEFLLVMFGLHPRQEHIENNYNLFVKDPYCTLLFCQKIRDVFNSAKSFKEGKNTIFDHQNENFLKLCNEVDSTCHSMKNILKDGIFPQSYISTKERIDELIQLATKVKGMKYNFRRMEEWKKEYQRIRVSNSTISNAHITLLQFSSGMFINDIFFKFSKEEPKYERFTIYLKVDEETRPDLFLFLPSLNAAVSEGPSFVVSKMIESFWCHIFRSGYFPTTRIKDVLDPTLRQFFLSGIVRTNNPLRDVSTLPLSLKANFDPTFPLSLFLVGLPGAGKSSFARGLPVGLQYTIEQHLDPYCIARFVKQNLNKCIETLELEFEIRPNNNNLSVMSIVQSRRMAMRQSKPGLVVLNLEEMPMHSSKNNPNQLSVAQLISNRFGGRNSNYGQKKLEAKDGKYSETKTSTPRNSDKRSIGRDSFIVTIFTSNYRLAEESMLALKELELYQNLQTIDMISVSGNDRLSFANAYLCAILKQDISKKDSYCVDISTHNLDIISIVSDDGDTRALVKQLRMISFYVTQIFIGRNIAKRIEQHIIIDHINVSKELESCCVTVKYKTDAQTTSQIIVQHLKKGSYSNWYPIESFYFDARIESTCEKLKSIIGVSTNIFTELTVILNYWFSKILVPAVILSRDKKKINQLMDAIESSDNDVHCIRNVNSQTYKMLKSLYDPKDTPNLKDDILKVGNGKLVAIEIICPTEDSQLNIKEIIEDNPSMTAFSTTKSALYKAGLLFAISTERKEVTSAVMSRISFVL